MVVVVVGVSSSLTRSLSSIAIRNSCWATIFPSFCGSIEGVAVKTRGIGGDDEEDDDDDDDRVMALSVTSHTRSDNTAGPNLSQRSSSPYHSSTDIKGESR